MPYYLINVKLITDKYLVCAEPGDPHPNENHGRTPQPDGYLNSAYSYAWDCFITGKDLFHRNIRDILDLCWPNTSFEEKMRNALIMDAVLCSARREGGSVQSAVTTECGQRYLLKVIKALPNAAVVALGKKAQQRLLRLGFHQFIPAFAAAPPGCNYRGAKASWEKVAQEIRKARPN